MNLSKRLVLAAVFVPTLAIAQGTDPSKATGLRKELIAQMNDVEQKLVSLTNAMTPAQLIWKPVGGGRTYAETIMHVAIENLDIPPMAGVASSPIKPAANAEKTTTGKAALVDILTKSFTYAKQSVMAVPDAQMDALASYFGTQMSKRGILMALATHGNEHLGQLVAYARMNSVVPPWSK